MSLIDVADTAPRRLRSTGTTPLLLTDAPLTFAAAPGLAMAVTAIDPLAFSVAEPSAEVLPNPALRPVEKRNDGCLVRHQRR